MAKPGGASQAGMEPAELKRLLRQAADAPVQAAFAIGGDGRPILMLDKRKQPRALEKELKDGAPDAKNHRHGSVSVDPNDPKLACFTVNKAASGMAGKLVKALKGTGFSKVRIILEDGTELEAHEEQDDGANAGADTGGDMGGDAGGNRGASGPDEMPPATGDGAVSVDGNSLRRPTQDGAAEAARTLAGLVRRTLDAIKADPSQRAALTVLATDAQGSLRRGDLNGTMASMDVLRMALDDLSAGPAAQGARTAGRPPPPIRPPAQPGAQAGVHGANHPATPTILKAASAWTATRQRIEREVATLTKQFEAAFTDHEMADELMASFKARVESVLQNLDEALTHKLDEVAKAHDAAQRAKLVDEAHTVVARYSQHIAADPTIKQIDENPFVPMALAKTLTATLSTLSKSIH